MKNYKIIVIISIFIILILTGCPVTEEEEEDYDLKIVSASANTIPANYDPGDGTTVNFLVTLKNNGKDIKSDYTVVAAIVVEDQSGLSYDQLMFTADYICGDGVGGLKSDSTQNFTFNGEDISYNGSTGNNYFYAIVYLLNSTYSPVNEDEESNNVIQLNTSSCVRSALPHESWSGPTTLVGGDASSDASLASLDCWYTSTVVSPNTMWYSVSVSTLNTYEIYWDDDYQGSGNYTGDIDLYVYHPDGTTLYAVSDSGYITPITVTTIETTILIQVDPKYEDGSFAFGIRQQ